MSKVSQLKCTFPCSLCIPKSSPIEKNNPVSNISDVSVKLSTIMRAKCNLSIATIIKVSLLGYVIYFSVGAMCVSWKINNIAKWAISETNSDRRMQSSSLDGVVRGEYNGVGLDKISNICDTGCFFFNWLASLDWKIMLVSFPTTQMSGIETWSEADFRDPSQQHV